MNTTPPINARPYRRACEPPGDEMRTTTPGRAQRWRQIGWHGQSGAFYALDEKPTLHEPGSIAALWLLVDNEPSDQHAAEVRAAALTEAADAGNALALGGERDVDVLVYELYCLATAARPEPEAHPAEHSWAAELYDPLADEWVPGTRYTDRDRAVQHLEHATKVGWAWKDGSPVQRRLVRSTTTHTVEQPAAARPVDFSEVIARCPEHGTRTETYAECRCASAREAAAQIAAAARPDDTRGV